MAAKHVETPITIDLPASVFSLLRGVRRKLRVYSVSSGLLFVLAVFAGVFWLTLGIDASWFAVQKLELPIGLRAIMLCMMVIGSLVLIGFQVLQPLTKRHPDKDVALLLEHKFPEFQDRLLTTVQASDTYPESGPIVENLLLRTVRETGHLAADVDQNALFDLASLKSKGVVAGLLLFSIAGCGILQPQSVRRWWSAFIHVAPIYHERTTKLEFVVIAQPGDRRRELTSLEGRLSYKHASGEDFELQMVVPEGHSSLGQPWVVPDRVRVDVHRADGSRSRTYVSATGNNTFRFILTRLQETVSIEVLGGDFRTPQPIVITCVEPPAIDSMQALCEYPTYTGWNELRGNVQEILGSEVALPMGTAFQLELVPNKRLQSLRLVTDNFDVFSDRTAATITWKASQNQVNLPYSFLADDGSVALIPISLQLPDIVADAGPTEQLLISPNTSLKFFLHDEDDIISTTPETLRVRGIEDQSPVIATQTTGVGNAITRRAIIPVAGTIADDYGLASAGYEFIIDDQSNWRPREFRSPLKIGVTEYRLFDGEKSERFDVQPLELTEGQTLALSIVASDFSSQPAPNQSRSEPVLFRVVSDQELLSLLYGREVNLRRQFEETIEKLKQVQSDLRFHKDIAKRLQQIPDSATAVQDRTSVAECARRSADTIRSQTNSLRSVLQGFEEVVEQLVNNQIPPASAAATMRNNIVAPLRQAINKDLDACDKAISSFRVATSENRPTLPLIEQSDRAVASCITELVRILLNVKDLAEFHEVLGDLNDILEEQKKIQKATEEERIRNLGIDYK